MAAQRARLVGRAAELTQLIEALKAAGDRRPAIAIVSGEAGIGKTRLVEELVDHAQTAGFLVAAGACSPVSSTRLPYGPIVDLVADVLRQCPELAASVPTEVWRGVGPLAGHQHADTAAPDQALASTRMFAGFAEFLAVESSHRPILLVIEDLHWADPASVDLIAFAARKLRRNRILLLITNRPAGASRRSPVRSTLAELRRLPDTVDITLGGLPDAALQELLDELPTAPDPDRRERITELSEGIPFFALHLAAHVGGGAVPSRLRDVMLGSLDDLSSGERVLLIELTVMGDLKDDQLLVRAIGSSPADFNQRARELVERGLIVVRDGAIGFRHALLREVMIEDTLPSERVLAHSRAADALLASSAAHEAKRAAQLAHHLLECGRHVPATRYAIRGARHAGNLWAFADARMLYAAVRRLWPLIDAPDAETGVTYPELLIEAAMVSRWCGDFEDARSLLREALDLEALSADQYAAIEHAYGRVLLAAGDVRGSLAAQRRAEAALPPGTNEGLRSAVMAALAHGLMATGLARRAEAAARAAATVAGAAGADRERIHAEITAAVARAQLGDVEASIAGLRSCLPEARRLDDLELVLRCYGNLTFVFGIACRYEELASAAAEGIDVSLRYGPVLSLASTLMINQVSALFALGRWDQAVTAAQEALSEQTSHDVALHLRLTLAEVAINRGNTAEADRHLAEARTLGADNPYALSALAVVLADRELWQGNPRAAAASIEGALPDLQRQDDALPLLEACWLGLRAAADIAASTIPMRRSGAQPGDGGTLLDLALDASSRTDLPVASALLLASQAEADRARGSDSATQWTAAAAANLSLNRPYFRAYCLMRLGAVQLRSHARAAAARSLTEGLETAQTLGAEPLNAEIRTLVAVSDLHLDASRRKAEHTAPDNTFGLTPRERQILALLTTGATNRAIGRSLFISERTASVHVSNILAKLGAANRTEAARIALRINMDLTPP